MNRRLAPVLALMLGGASCSDNPATSPTPVVVAPVGNWSGSISDAISGDGTMQLALTEQAAGSLNSLGGTWTATFKDGEGFSGPAVGGLYTPNGYGIMLYVGQPLPACLAGTGAGGSALVSFTLINVVVTSSRLTATAGRLSCTGGPVFGTISLSKQ